LKRVLFLFVFALFSLSHSLFSVVNIEISELVRLLAGGNNAQPITELLFLQVLLDQVFEVSLRKGGLGKNSDFSLLALELDSFTKSSSLSVNLDVLGEEGFKTSGIEDSVFNGLTAIENKFQSLFLSLLGLLYNFLNAINKKLAKMPKA
jgi:hypothetical protein